TLARPALYHPSLTLPRPPSATLFPYTNALPISASPRWPEQETRSTWSRRDSTKHPENTKPHLALEVGFNLLCPRHVRSSTEGTRSEEHTSELQSRENLVCRLLLEKKKRRIRAET